MRNKAWFNLVFMLVCTVVITGVLSGVHVYTRPMIQANNRKTEIMAQMNALNIAIPSAADSAGLEAFYDSKVKEQTAGGLTYYRYEDENGEVSYAIPFTGSGLWGKIFGVIALDKDMKKVIGIDFISQNETPGLGGRIEEGWFKNQFRNIALNDSGAPIRYKTSDSDGQVDAITGATITSTAVVNMMNEYINEAKSKVGGGS